MEPDKKMITRYFRGECSAEEAAAVEAYLQQPDHSELNAFLEEAWNGEIPAPVVMKPVRGKMFKYWYGVAAAITLLFTAGAWLWNNNGGNRRVVAAADVRDTLRNEGDNVRVLLLSDGSRVWLSAYSSLIYTNRYNDTSRDLWLNGEAYFEVAHDEHRPFKIHTAEVTTIALGTAFNIATGNRADGSIEVSLVEGRISVGTQKDIYLLNPGQMVSYRKNELKAPVRFNEGLVLDWKKGKLLFDETRLEDVFSKLQSRYGCRIVLEGEKKLAMRKVSGSFSRGERLTDILDALKYVHNFSYKVRDGHVYIISGNK